MTNQTEIAGNNGHYAPCTAQELITWIDNLLADSAENDYIDTGDCLDVIEACKAYLEWYNGSNQT